MSFPTFALERHQSLYENTVEFNLTESGVEALTLGELIEWTGDAPMDLRLGYGHTEGTPELREAIASWYPGATAANVLVTHGTAEANFLAFWTLMRPGDGLAMMRPNFMQLDGLARAFGNPVRRIDLKPTAAGWALDRESLAAATSGEGTRLLAICNPNNPTGAILSEAEMDAIVAAAERCGAWILADEIYRGLEIGERAETATFYGRSERVLVTSSASKALAHAGLRIGWAVAPEALIAELVERQDYTTIGTGPLSQRLAAAILAPDAREKMLRRSRALIGANLEIVGQWVERWNGRLSWRPPQAGGMAFVAYDFPIASAALSDRLRLEKSVFVVAGEWFGLDGHMRIGTGGEGERLSEALRRIDEVLETLA